MRTTEVFIEQLLIGLLVLAAAGALLHPPLFNAIADADLGTLALLGAGAYLTGIAYDRLADTFLAGVDRHHRLTFALEEQKEWTRRALTPAVHSIVEADPYPENVYRIALFESEETTEYAHYLRTRMRLTRAVATLGPAMAAGAALLLLDSDAGWIAPVLAGSTLVAYTLVFLLGLFATERKPDPSPQKGWHPRFKLPKTFEGEDLAIYRGRLGLDERERLTGKEWLHLLVTGTWAVPVLLGVTLVNGAVLFLGASPLLSLLPLAGFLISLLFGWVWWRITDTFFQFIRDHYLYRHTSAGAAGEAAGKAAGGPELLG